MQGHNGGPPLSTFKKARWAKAIFACEEKPIGAVAMAFRLFVAIDGKGRGAVLTDAEIASACGASERRVRDFKRWLVRHNFVVILTKGARGRGTEFQAIIPDDTSANNKEIPAPISGNSEEYRRPFPAIEDELPDNTSANHQMADTASGDRTDSRARISKPSKVSNNNIYNNNLINKPNTARAREETRSWAEIMADERGETPNVTGVVLENDTVVLMNGTRTKWLEMFDGDDKRLDLALIEISAELQPNSGKPLHIDVESRLARRAAWKRDGDKRYEKRTNPGKGKSKNSKPAKKPTEQQMRIWAGASE